MPTLTTHHSLNRVKLLVVGDSGGGKTAVVSQLANHGQRLFFADFDDGLDVARHFVKPENHKNLVYETLTDKLFFDANGRVTYPGAPTAFPKAIQLLQDWKDSDGTSYGSPAKFGENDWLVVDSWSGLSAAAKHYTAYANGRYGYFVKKDGSKKPKKFRINDWGDAIDRVEGVLQYLHGLPANVIIIAHLMRLTPSDDFDDDEDGETGGADGGEAVQAPSFGGWYRRYPSTLGKSLPPRMGGYFNSVVQVKQSGVGLSARPIIRTVPDSDLDLKLPVPPKSLPIEVPGDRLIDVVNAIKGVK